MNRFTRWLNKPLRVSVDYDALIAVKEAHRESVLEGEAHREQLEALVRAQERYGDGQSMNHPRLTRAILRAKKHLGELGGVLTSKPSKEEAKDLLLQMRWGYSIAAAFLDSRADPSSIKRYVEAE